MTSAQKGRIEAEAAFFRRTVAIGGEDLALKDLARPIQRRIEAIATLRDAGHTVARAFSPCT